MDAAQVHERLVEIIVRAAAKDDSQSGSYQE
jgi:hypothetical protein